ncbi:MAG: helix-turn-helix domain-containing protein [Zavarzinella sp.]
MIRPNITKWNQTTDDLRRLALESEHPRTRERFMALYQIALGHTNATAYAAEIGRCDDMLLNWVHKYNNHGPDALIYRVLAAVSPFCPVADRADR